MGGGGEKRIEGAASQDEQQDPAEGRREATYDSETVGRVGEVLQSTGIPPVSVGGKRLRSSRGPGPRLCSSA